MGTACVRLSSFLLHEKKNKKKTEQFSRRAPPRTQVASWTSFCQMDIEAEVYTSTHLTQRRAVHYAGSRRERNTVEQHLSDRRISRKIVLGKKQKW